jgi:hypothetical protein
VIFGDKRDPRLVTVRRGGTLTDEDHRRLALWAVECAEHVLKHFEDVRPDDRRPRDALETAKAWARGEATMSESRNAAFAANAAAHDLAGPAREAAHAAGQAAAVPHVAEHELGAAAYGIKAVRGASPEDGRDAAGRAERDWQRGRLPDEIRQLVLEDQARRDANCWGLFGD